MQNASKISLGEKTGKRHRCDIMDVTGGLHEAVLNSGQNQTGGVEEWIKAKDLMSPYNSFEKSVYEEKDRVGSSWRGVMNPRG